MCGNVIGGILVGLGLVWGTREGRGRLVHTRFWEQTTVARLPDLGVYTLQSEPDDEIESACLL